MIVQTIKRLSIHGSNVEISEMAPNIWVLVFHTIDFERRASVYAGTKICTSEQEAFAEAELWIDKREEYDERCEAF